MLKFAVLALALALPALGDGITATLLSVGYYTNAYTTDPRMPGAFSCLEYGTSFASCPVDPSNPTGAVWSSAEAGPFFGAASSSAPPSGSAEALAESSAVVVINGAQGVGYLNLVFHESSTGAGGAGGGLVDLNPIAPDVYPFGFGAGLSVVLEAAAVTTSQYASGSASISVESARVFTSKPVDCVDGLCSDPGYTDITSVLLSPEPNTALLATAVIVIFGRKLFCSSTLRFH
jgi:hypothetical protein